MSLPGFLPGRRVLFENRVKSADRLNLINTLCDFELKVYWGKPVFYGVEACRSGRKTMHFSLDRIFPKYGP